MNQYGRVAGSLRNRGLARWLAAASVVAASAPLGCAVYEPSLLPSDDVAGLQADAGAQSASPEGGAGGIASVGRAGGESASAGAQMAANGGEGGGANAGGTGGSSTDHAGAASSSGAGGAGSSSGVGASSGFAGAGPSGGSTSGGSTSGGSTSGGQGGLGSAGSGVGGSAGASATPAVVLSLGKPVTASSEQAGNEAPRGNDTDLSTRWCALHGTFPQWWRVDLGAKHKLSDFRVKFEHGERKYSYQVETSNDDSVYTLQSTISGSGDVQSDTFASGLSARYVRITVTAADPYVSGTTTYPTWASFWDFRVTGW